MPSPLSERRRNTPTWILTLSLVCAASSPSIVLGQDTREERRGAVEKLKESLRRQEEIDRVQAEVLRQETEQKKENLKRQLETVKWALNQFEMENRGLLSGVPAVKGYHAKLMKGTENFKARLLRDTEHNQGAIESGRALNLLVQVCGPTACKHVMLDTAREEAQNLQEALRKGIPPEPKAGDANRPDTREFFRGISGSLSLKEISPDILNSITTQSRETGNRDSRKLNGGVLDFGTPPRKLREAKYKDQLKEFDRARTQAIDELAENRPIENETLDDLKNSLDALDRAVRKDRIEYFQKVGHKEEGPAHTQARDYLRKAKQAIYRAAEYTSVSDYATSTFTGGNAEELIAFMYENQRLFDKAGPNAKDEYSKLFRIFLDYYLTLLNGSLAIQAAEAEIKKLEVREEKLLDRATQSLTTMEKYLIDSERPQINIDTDGPVLEILQGVLEQSGNM